MTDKTLRIGVDGEITIEDFDGTLDRMYELIECQYVDRISLIQPGPGRLGIDLWLDDEGLLVNEPEMNRIVGEMTGRPIAGNVIVLTVDAAGESGGFHLEHAEMIKNRIEVAHR